MNKTNPDSLGPTLTMSCLARRPILRGQRFSLHAGKQQEQVAVIPNDDDPTTPYIARIFYTDDNKHIDYEGTWPDSLKHDLEAWAFPRQQRSAIHACSSITQS